MFKILCEQPYRESLWCQEILCDLLLAMKKKRLQYTEIADTSQLQTEDTVFFNDGSLNNCFSSFRPVASLFDAVICVNGLGCSKPYSKAATDGQSKP